MALYLLDAAAAAVRWNAAIKAASPQFEGLPNDLSNVVVRTGKKKTQVYGPYVVTPLWRLWALSRGPRARAGVAAAPQGAGRFSRALTEVCGHRAAIRRGYCYPPSPPPPPCPPPPTHPTARRQACPPSPRPAGAARSAMHAWPADMHSRRDSH